MVWNAATPVLCNFYENCLESPAPVTKSIIACLNHPQPVAIPPPHMKAARSKTKGLPQTWRALPRPDCGRPGAMAWLWMPREVMANSLSGGTRARGTCSTGMQLGSGENQRPVGLKRKSSECETDRVRIRKAWPTEMRPRGGRQRREASPHRPRTAHPTFEPRPLGQCPTPPSAVRSTLPQ